VPPSGCLCPWAVSCACTIGNKEAMPKLVIGTVKISCPDPLSTPFRKMHGRGGGKWNKAWEIFIKLNEAKNKGPIKAERIMGFAFAMLQNIGMEAVPFL
jgi:hypothetical protein